MQMMSRTQANEWRIVDQLYPSLHRFSAVVAPSDLEPDDLLQEALVAVLRRHRLSALDHPAAYLRKAILTGDPATVLRLLPHALDIRAAA